MLKVIKLLFVLFLLIIISSVSVLFLGIKIDSFSINNINVSQFYIKLDKKLIVDIEKIEYKSKKSKTNNSIDDIKKNLDLLPKILNIFKRININSLKIDGNEFVISLTDDFIYLDNKLINLSTKYDFVGQKLQFDLYSLYLKDYDVLFDGKVKVDYLNEKLEHFGSYLYGNLQGEVKLTANDKKLDFFVNAKAFKSLSFLKNFFRLSKEAEAWMYDNVKGDINLEEFYGSVDLVKMTLDEKSLKARGYISNAKIKFNKKLSQRLNAEKINILYEKDRLSFDLVNPIYKNKSLKGSKVKINNLTSEKKGEVVIDILANSMLDKDVLEVLNAFDINLPLLQTSGKTSAKVHLVIPYSLKRKMITKGTFKVKNGKMSLNNFIFLAKKAEVILDGTMVKIKNAHVLHKNMINTNLNLDINTKTLTAKGDALIKSFLIKADKTKIIHVRNKKTKLDVDFSKDVKIELKDLFTKILIGEYIKVNVSKIKHIYKYSNLLKELSVKDGYFNLSMVDENDISFNAFVKGLTFPLMKKGKKLTQTKINGVIKDNYIRVSSNDKNIEYKLIKKKEYLSLRNLTIFVNTKEKKEEKTPILDITMNNMKLKIDKDVYFIKNGKANLSKKEISFFANLRDLKLPIKTKTGKDIKELHLRGKIKKDNIFITNKARTIKLELKKNKLNLDFTGYDLYLDTNSKGENKINYINVKAKNSNIIVNNKFKFLADFYDVRLREKSKYLNLTHKKTEMIYKELKDEKVNIYGTGISSDYINSIFGDKILKGGNMLLSAKGKKNDIKGKLLITKVRVEDLAILNNLLLFVHTSPALINPLLAIPSLIGTTKGGFNLAGYNIIDGLIEFKYNMPKKLLDINKLVTIGNGIDFDGKGKIDLNTNTIKSKIKMIFFKDYSSIVGMIPVVNYVLLGSDKRVETEVNLFGPLANPKISTNLTKDAFSVPVNIAKRVLTSPLKFVEFLNDLTKENPKVRQRKEDINK